jgi:hypothetical protein
VLPLARGPPCLWWGADDFHTGGAEHRVERRGELRIAVVQQEPELVGSFVERHQHVPCLLGDPGTGRVGGGTDDVDLAGHDSQEEQHGDALEEHRVDVTKSQARMVWAWADRNCCQVGPNRHGAGSTPAWWRIFHTVLAATR